jgi:hypothetical protein
MNNVSEYWLKEIVIGLDLCPFARIPYSKGLIRIVECEHTIESEKVSFFLDELDHLQKKTILELSTTLIVFNKEKSDFLDFNDFVGLCEEMLEAAKLEEHFQLVVFHPQFQLEGKEVNDRANWIGRSPYPTIHILRNAEIESIQENYADVLEIPARNESKLHALSEVELNKLFYFLNTGESSTLQK